jgi:hypothetical protein
VLKSDTKVELVQRQLYSAVLECSIMCGIVTKLESFRVDFFARKKFCKLSHVLRGEWVAEPHTEPSGNCEAHKHTHMSLHKTAELLQEYKKREQVVELQSCSCKSQELGFHDDMMDYLIGRCSELSSGLYCRVK